MNKVGSLLESFFSAHDTWHIQLLNNWNRIMGPLAAHVQLEKIDADTLVLGVFDSCWLQELYLLSPLLLKTINENLDQPRIKQLRFKKTGVVKKKATAEKLAPKKVQDVQLKQREIDALRALDDKELAQALKQFLIRCYQERQ